MSNTRDTNLYTKITCDNTCENDDNTHSRLCQLKLNDMDCHIICRVKFVYK